MRTKWRLWIALAATALWLCFIYARSARNADLSNTESLGLLALLQRLFPALAGTLASQTAHYVLRKLAHFTEYLILGGLARLDCLLLGRRSPILPLLLCLTAAAADEFLQTFIPGRSGQISDVLLDVAGAALGLFLVSRIRKRKERNEFGR